MTTLLRGFPVLALCLVLSGCGLFQRSLRVGSKGTAEQLVLGEITAQLLEKGNFKVDRRLGLGDSSILHSAISSREVDVYPEDMISAITLIMKERAIMDTTSMWERIRTEFGRQYGIRVLEPLGARNSTVFVVLKSLADRESLTDLSAAAASKIQWQLAVSPEFAAGPDGQMQLAGSYKLQQRFEPLSLSGVEMYQALRKGQVNMVVGTETDGLLPDPAFARLADDKQIFPPSQICLIAREGAFADYPGLDAVLKRLAGKVSTQDLARMVRDVEVGKMEPAAVAKDFLARTGL